jgi:VCBS repeat-containing protein
MARGEYSIEARSMGVVGGLASHNFWVLRGPNGEAIAELHGLATDRNTGEAVPIGTDNSKHSLRVHHLIHDGDYAYDMDQRQTSATYIKAGQKNVTVMTGSRDEVLRAWGVAATDGANLINQRNLDYPNLGFDPFGKGINSNSVYRTLGRVMVGYAHEFSGVRQPGIDHDALSVSEISLLRGYVLDRPRASVETGGERDGIVISPATGVSANLASNDSVNREQDRNTGAKLLSQENTESRTTFVQAVNSSLSNLNNQFEDSRNPFNAYYQRTVDLLTKQNEASPLNLQNGATIKDFATHLIKDGVEQNRGLDPQKFNDLQLTQAANGKVFLMQGQGDSAVKVGANPAEVQKYSAVNSGESVSQRSAQQETNSVDPIERHETQTRSARTM